MLSALVETCHLEVLFQLEREKTFWLALEPEITFNLINYFTVFITTCLRTFGCFF